MRGPFGRSDEPPGGAPHSHRAWINPNPGGNVVCGFPRALVGHPIWELPDGACAHSLRRAADRLNATEHPKTDRGANRSGTGGVHSTVEKRSAYLNSGKRRALPDGANFYRSALPNRAGF
jgi:hypothetical protein